MKFFGGVDHGAFVNRRKGAVDISLVIYLEVSPKPVDESDSRLDLIFDEIQTRDRIDFISIYPKNQVMTL
jgi:hypothetical protein